MGRSSAVRISFRASPLLMASRGVTDKIHNRIAENKDFFALDKFFSSLCEILYVFFAVILG